VLVLSLMVPLVWGPKANSEPRRTVVVTVRSQIDYIAD
jgi:hypothetical protein